MIRGTFRLDKGRDHRGSLLREIRERLTKSASISPAAPPYAGGASRLEKLLFFFWRKSTAGGPLFPVHWKEALSSEVIQSHSSKRYY
ncbi:unnamed protein product [Nezara viridula]|uniref:Uncharacterized protein n=1 Tax=Nezara viridula TaxID=85310 RepID=A0A9P0H9W7_NEZVI|nr:unnamed protein product [Nezara viridula]